MLEDIVIRLDDDFSSYLSDIRENENLRIENEKLRNEFFKELLRKSKSYYEQIRKMYKTISEKESVFALPEGYTDLCMLAVFVNGFFLNEGEYKVVDRNVVLTKPLDVIGSTVELVVTRLVNTTVEDYENLKGLSAYEVAVKNGFVGSIEEWLSSLKGVGSYNRRVTVYETTVKNEKEFAMPSYYAPGCFKDVFVNGFKLTEDEYGVELRNGLYTLVLKNALDVIGSRVEIDVIESDVPEEGSRVYCE